MLSPWDKIQSPAEAPIKLALMGFNPGNHRVRGFALKGREITMRLMGGITREIWSPFRALRRGDTVPRVETLG
jgi:hypothetical protein